MDLDWAGKYVEVFSVIANYGMTAVNLVLVAIA
jgi:hypothetical protein